MMRVGARRPAAACLMALTVAACFLMSTADCMTPKTMIRPRTIYHAFNQHIRDVTHKVDHWKETGFDAVQLSPLQKSKGNEWWARYQPVSFNEIDGLGNKGDLAELCRACKDKGICVIADVVFNHMAVVASRDEWMRAQRDKGYNEELLGRLDNYFKPLDRNDFNPWMDMMGDDWDDDTKRFEGWGAGEWSDIRPTERVLNWHKGHIKDLVDCGVTGFRFDAAKHMRPATLRIYVDYIRSICPDAYIYLEVLSGDPRQHKPFAGWADTTDFKYCFSLVDAINGHHPLRDIPPVPLEDDNVHFVRNHDTIQNTEFARSHSLCTSDPKLASAWVQLLAQPSGTALLYPDDVEINFNNHFPVKAALKFRREMDNRQAESAKIVKVCGNDVVEDKKAAEEKKKEEGKRSFWGKKDKEPELDPSLQQKLEDADELEQFAIASKRKGTRNLLLEQIMRIREEVHREKEEFEKRKKDKHHGGRDQKDQKDQKDKHVSKEEQKHRDKNREKTAEILAILRGVEGAVLCNMGTIWCDETTFERATEGTLKGVYTELVYGFEVEFDDRGRVIRWADKVGSKVHFGPKSCLVLVKNHGGARSVVNL